MSQKERIEREQIDRALEADDSREKAKRELKKTEEAFEEVLRNKGEGRAVKDPAKRVVKHAQKTANAAGKAKKAADESREAAEEVKKIAEATGEDSDEEFSEDIADWADRTELDADDAKDASADAQGLRGEAEQIAELKPEEIKEAESQASDEES